MILQVHDELVFEVKENEVKDFLIMIKEKMENVTELLVPLTVKAGAGENWQSAKEK